MKRMFAMLPALAMTLTMTAQTQVQHGLAPATELSAQQKQQEAEREAERLQKMAEFDKHKVAAVADYNAKRSEADAKRNAFKTNLKSANTEMMKALSEMNSFQPIDEKRGEVKLFELDEQSKKIGEVIKANRANAKRMAKAKANAESTVPYVEKLDAIVAEGDYKNVYEYDENGLITKETYYTWDAKSNDWKLSSEYRIEYDNNIIMLMEFYQANADGELVLMTVRETTVSEDGEWYEFDAYRFEDGEKLLDTKYKLQYDDNGYAKTSIYYRNNNGEWVPGSRYERTYNDKGFIISEITSYYSEELGDFKFDSYWVGGYDERGNRIYSGNYSYNEQGERVLREEDKWTFDENGNRTSYEYIYYRDGKINYAYDYVYTYDDANRRLTAFSRRYNTQTGIYENESYEEHAYDETGRETMRLSQRRWKEGTGYTEGDKYEYPDEYTTIFYLFDVADQTWVLNSKEVNKTTADGTVIEESYSNYNGEVWTQGGKMETSVDETTGIKTILHSNLSDDQTWNGIFRETLKKDARTDFHMYENFEYGEWYIVEKQEILYDEKGRQTQDERWDWNFDRWQLFATYKCLHEYDSEDRMVYEGYFSGMQNGVWVGESYSKQAYDEEGRQTLYEYAYGWDVERNCWGHGSKSVAEYNEDGYWTLQEVYSLVAGEWEIQVIKIRSYHNNYYSNVEDYSRNNAGEFVGDTKYCYTYDDNDNTLAYDYYNWDKTAGAWNLSRHTAYNYVDGRIDNYVTTIIGGVEEVTQYYYNANGTIDHITRTTDEGQTVVAESTYVYDGDYTTIETRYMEGGVVYAMNKEIVGKGAGFSSYVSYRKDNETEEWRGNYANEYRYDDRDRVISYIYKSSYSDGEWLEGFRQIITYDDDDVCTSYTESRSGSYASDEEGWWRDGAVISKYDEAGRDLVRGYINWDNNSQTWTDGERFDYTYDEKGRCMSNLSYRWENGQFCKSYLTNYIWNDKEVIGEQSYYAADDGSWRGFEYRIREWDAATRYSRYEFYYWSDDINDWMGSSKSEYYSHPNGRIKQETNYYDYRSGVWRTFSRYTNDENGNRIFEETFTWDDEKQAYVGNYASSYILNGNGTISEASYTWNTETNEWDGAWYNLGRVEYDKDGYKSYQLVGVWNAETRQWEVLEYTFKYYFDETADVSLIAGFGGGKKILKIEAYTKDGLAYTTTYYYSGIGETDAIATVIGTNPDAAIYDLQGRRLTAPSRIFIQQGKKIMK